MEDLLVYLKNINWTVIVDIIVIIALATILLIFFKKRNSLKQAIFYSLFSLAYIAVNVICAVSETNVMYITKRLFDYLAVFVVAAFAVIYQADLKQMVSRLSKSYDMSKVDYTEEDLRIARRDNKPNNIDN